jgi:hypothetical protein
MNDYTNTSTSSSFSMQSALQGFRVMGALLGIIAMITGLVYTSKLFTMVLYVLKTPDAAHSIFKNWATALGDNQLILTVQGDSFDMTLIATLLIVGTGALLLTYIALTLITTGAKILSWTLGDKEAIKKILTSTFGTTKKDKPRPQEVTPPSPPKP